MNLPNKLSVLRICLVPVFIIVMMLPETLFPGFAIWGPALGAFIFIVASFTDMLDGKIARKYNLITDFGKFIDPLADKFMVIGALLVIVYRYANIRPVFIWANIIVIFRELAVTSIRLIAAGKSGKFKTASTMIGLCFWMAFPSVEIIGTVVVWVIVITTIYSGVEYFIQNWNCLWD